MLFRTKLKGQLERVLVLGSSRTWPSVAMMHPVDPACFNWFVREKRNGFGVTRRAPNRLDALSARHRAPSRPIARHRVLSQEIRSVSVSIPAAARVAGPGAVTFGFATLRIVYSESGSGVLMRA